MPVERPAGDVDDPAHQRVAVGVQARAGHRHEHVALAHPVRPEDLVGLHHAGHRAGHVVLVRAEQAGVLGGLAADEGARRPRRTPAAMPCTMRRDALRDDPAAGDVVGHEQRLGAAHDDVVDDHADQVEADRVVHVERLRDRDLGAHAVGAGRQQRRGMPGSALASNSPAKPPSPPSTSGRVAWRPHCLHQLDGLVTGLDVDTGGGVGDRLGMVPAWARPGVARSGRARSAAPVSRERGAPAGRASSGRGQRVARAAGQAGAHPRPRRGGRAPRHRAGDRCDARGVVRADLEAASRQVLPSRSDCGQLDRVLAGEARRAQRGRGLARSPRPCPPRRCNRGSRRRCARGSPRRARPVAMSSARVAKSMP